VPIPFRRRGSAPQRVLVAAADHAFEATARRVVRALHAGASRRVDLDDPRAEVYRLFAAGGGEVTVSRLLANLVQVGLSAAQASTGLVDPTVGAAVVAARVRTFAGRPTVGPGVVPACGSPDTHRPRPAPRYDRVAVRGNRIRAPQGTMLDLRATTDAVVASAAATRAAGRTGTGVLVVVGGDVAQAGAPPPDGWWVRLPDGARFRLPAGLAASTVRPGDPPPHRVVVDPGTGAGVAPAWHGLTVLHRDVLAAKQLCLSAAVLGDGAVAFLRCEGVPFRLVGRGDAVTTSAGWPGTDIPEAHVPASGTYLLAG
jgi:thiamine biosynthesis lipoprotein